MDGARTQSAFVCAHLRRRSTVAKSEAPNVRSLSTSRRSSSPSMARARDPNARGSRGCPFMEAGSQGRGPSLPHSTSWTGVVLRRAVHKDLLPELALLGPSSESFLPPLLPPLPPQPSEGVPLVDPCASVALQGTECERASRNVVVAAQRALESRRCVLLREVSRSFFLVCKARNWRGRILVAGSVSRSLVFGRCGGLLRSPLQPFILVQIGNRFSIGQC